MGTPEFAVPALELLLSSHHKIAAVVTVPDKPKGRGLKVSQSAVKKFASNNNLRILQPESLKDEEFVFELTSISPDVIIVVAFRILPKEVFQVPKFGSFNLHASLLPKYRGAAPFNWAIINGESETGVTTFFLNETVDTGNIILQNKCEITDDDTAGSLHDKLAGLGASTVLSTLNLIEKTNGNVPVYPQEESMFTSAPKITKEFCRINWDNTFDTLHNFIRGLSPFPAAYTTHNGKILKIFKTCKTEKQQDKKLLPFAPGKVFILEGRFFISGNDGFLEVLELQLEGKKHLLSSEFLNGYKFRENDMLGT